MCLLISISTTNDPEALLDAWLTEATSGERVWAVEYDYIQYYLPEEPVIRLLAIYCLSGDHLSFTVAVASKLLSEQLLNTEESLVGFHGFARKNNLPVFHFGQPLTLQPVSIAKPWGQEIWYTGIEERGVSRVTDGLDSVPLPWVMSVAPKRLVANCERKINLLKILDPLPEEVYGDLYFELHKEKREVYVVTHVDQQAWPDGVGAIRYGFDPEMRKHFSSDDDFRAAYLKAVGNYEQIRRQIDQLLDSCRQQEGIALDAPVPADVMKRWAAMLPAIVLEQEQMLRQEMNRFTSLLPLKQGDVVKVPLLTPHSLQHGVRTVEFQTPVYERMILSFAQKVLTQHHWDTARAVDIMAIDNPSIPDLDVLEETSEYRLEEVVRFDDFQVQRLTLGVGHSYLLSPTNDYALMMVVEGFAECSGITSLGSEQAVLLPAERSDIHIINNVNNDADVVLLLAMPL